MDELNHNDGDRDSALIAGRLIEQLARDCKSDSEVMDALLAIRGIAALSIRDLAAKLPRKGTPGCGHSSIDDYGQFLRDKVQLESGAGFEVSDDEINPICKPHQRAGIRWALRGGRRALFERFGLGKSIQQLEIVRLVLLRLGFAVHLPFNGVGQPVTAPAQQSTSNIPDEQGSEVGGRGPVGGAVEAKSPARGLIVCPLGVRQEFKRDAVEKLGWNEPPKFVRFSREVEGDGVYLTNYESIRDGRLDPTLFSVVSLDEASCLRSFGSKTFSTFLFEGPLKQVPLRFVATATPSPNDFIELLAYAAFLDVSDIGHAKTRFFKRDSTKANNLTIHPHKEREFWLWVSSWALFLQSPADLGFDPAGYDLPELRVIKHEVAVDHKGALPEKSGQGRLYRDSRFGVSEAAKEKRDTLDLRIAKMVEILAGDPDSHYLIWHDLESERAAIEKAVPDVVTVFGKQDLDEREKAIIDFSEGKFKYLGAKPILAGSGTNFQYHCHKAIFTGVGFKFNDFIQAIMRILRYLQTEIVEIHIIYAESERAILEVLERKWAQHDKLVEEMSGIIKQYGLSHEAMARELTRAFGVARREVSGNSYRLINNDAVLELAQMPENSVDLILTSIPFCYDQETRILTQRGWIGFGDLGCADEVATVNPRSLCFEWQRPTKTIWEHYQGEMLQFGSRVFDLVVTPNHRMFAARRGQGFGPAKLGAVEARQIAADYSRARRKGSAQGRLARGWRTCVIPPAIGEGLKPERIDIPPLPDHVRSGHGVQLYWIEAGEFMALAGWYLSEGFADSFSTSRSGGRISIAQVKSQRLRAEICDLFVRIGLPPSLHSRQISAWCRNLAYFLITEFGSGAKKKRIPLWVRNLHPDLLRILRDTMMKGDGATSGASYASFSEELRDHFQEICLKTGWRATIKNHWVKVGSKQIYPEIRSAPKRIAYEGMIGCCSVPNGLLIVRRNGMPCVSGNSNQYEYSPNLADFGHSDGKEDFFRQMDYLTPNLLRVLKPGRVLAIHVKDRVVPGGMTGLGFQTVDYFHVDCIRHYEKHGFISMGMKTVVTDVVRENNQTYRLGWTEQCKDATKMGYGLPEYVLLFRKRPTDNSNSYADIPVVKSKDQYSRARWQIDAHGFSRSGGDRLLSPNEVTKLTWGQIYRLHRKYSIENVYDYEEHVRIGEDLDEIGRLPVDFMLLPPQSWHPDVWTDVTRMLGLNSRQKSRGRQMHLCPLQFDICDRIITQMSMPGEVVLDHFSGVGTVPLRAVKLGRRAIGIELNHDYFDDSVFYCEAAEQEKDIPSLFDLLGDSEADEAVLEAEPVAVGAGGR
jgi:DNA modification methylase